MRPVLPPVLLLLLCGYSRLGAQTPDTLPLASDRPGYSDAVNIVPRGILQFESGYSLNLSRSRAVVDPEGLEVDAQRNMLGGTPLLRLGLSKRIELRLGGDGLLYQSHWDATSRHVHMGMSDFGVGAKISLRDERHNLPAISLVTMFSVPAGSGRFSSSSVDPTVKLAWSKMIAEDVFLAGNLNIASLTDADERFWQKCASLQLSRPVYATLSGFLEAYAIFPVEHSGNTVWTFDGGLSYPLGQDMQLDLSFGQQLAPVARTWFVSIGVVIRGRVFGGGGVKDRGF